MSDFNPNTNNDLTNPVSTSGNSNAMRVTTDGEGAALVEYLRTEGSTAVRNTADVAYPNGEQFTTEIEGHNRAIADLTARLAEQDFDRSGKVKGFRVSDPTDRRNLELQIATRQNALTYTTQRLAEAHNAAQARADRRAKTIEAGQPDPEARPDSLAAAAEREQAVAELAERTENGQPIGRQRAAELYDRAANEEAARRLARGRG